MQQLSIYKCTIAYIAATAVTIKHAALKEAIDEQAGVHCCMHNMYGHIMYGHWPWPIYASTRCWWIPLRARDISHRGPVARSDH